MSKITRTNFKTTKDTKYADNTNEEITALDSREVHEDLADSVVFKIDDSLKSATTTNSGNDYSVTLDYPSSLTGNHLFLLRINAVNTGAATLAITPTGGSALTTKSLCDSEGNNFASGDLVANEHRLFTYDATDDKFKEVGLNKAKSKGSIYNINVSDGSGGWTSTGFVINASEFQVAQGDEIHFDLDGTSRDGHIFSDESVLGDALIISSNLKPDGTLDNTGNSGAFVAIRHGGFDFYSTTNGSSPTFDRRLSMSRNGVLTLNEAFSFPDSDGTANQVLKTDGSGTLTWADVLTSPTVSTYTPTLEFGGANVGLTYTIQSGEYTTVGKQCSVQIYVRVDDKGTSTGDITVSLPVAAKSTTPTVQILSCQVAPVSGGLNDVPYVARVSQGTSEVTLTEAFTSSAVVGTMDDADVGEPFIVLISGTYFTD